MYADDRMRVQRELADLITRGDTAQSEYRIKSHSGKYRWVYSVNRLERDETGRPWYYAIITDIDREKRMRETMIQERERYRIIVEESGAALFEWNYQDGVFYHSDSYGELYISTMDARKVFADQFAYEQVVHPQDTEAFSQFINRLVGAESAASCTLRVRMMDRSYKWAHITIAFLHNDAGAKTHAIGSVSIIDEIKQIEQTQRWQEERYRILMEDLNVATFDYDPATDVFTRMVNDPAKGVREKVIPDYSVRVQHSSVVHPDSVKTVLAALGEASAQTVSACTEYMARYGGGDYHWVRARYVSLADENGNVYRVIGKIDDIQDIKEIEQNATELKHIAEYDAVTGLLTRAAFEKAAGDYLGTRREPGDLGALIMLDVDNFKQINDTFGHLVGDKLLHEVATKTRDSFRHEDIIGRIGGDEFMALITRVVDEDMLRKRLDQLLRSLRQSVLPDGRSITGSLGARLIRPDDTDFQALYQQADDALYRAKKEGKNGYALSPL